LTPARPSANTLLEDRRGSNKRILSQRILLKRRLKFNKSKLRKKRSHKTQKRVLPKQRTLNSKMVSRSLRSQRCPRPPTPRWKLIRSILSLSKTKKRKMSQSMSLDQRLLEVKNKTMFSPTTRELVRRKDLLVPQMTGLMKRSSRSNKVLISTIGTSMTTTLGHTPTTTSTRRCLRTSRGLRLIKEQL
jgi:hypothetical protein